MFRKRLRLMRAILVYSNLKKVVSLARRFWAVLLLLTAHIVLTSWAASSLEGRSFGCDLLCSQVSLLAVWCVLSTRPLLSRLSVLTLGFTIILSFYFHGFIVASQQRLGTKRWDEYAWIDFLFGSSGFGFPLIFPSLLLGIFSLLPLAIVAFDRRHNTRAALRYSLVDVLVFTLTLGIGLAVIAVERPYPGWESEVVAAWLRAVRDHPVVFLYYVIWMPMMYATMTVCVTWTVLLPSRIKLSALTLAILCGWSFASVFYSRSISIAAGAMQMQFVEALKYQCVSLLIFCASLLLSLGVLYCTTERENMRTFGRRHVADAELPPTLEP